MAAPLRRAALLLLLAAASITGCTTVPDPLGYPPGWTSLRAAPLADGCPDLSGTYEASAAASSPAGPAPRLGEIFGPGFIEAPSPAHASEAMPGATSASLTLDGDMLHVRLRDDAGGELALRFRRIRFIAADPGARAFHICHASAFGHALQFTREPRQLGGWPLLYGTREVESLLLFKGEDGSLIVHRHVDRVRATVVVVGSEVRVMSSAWWRYPPLRADRLLPPSMR